MKGMPSKMFIEDLIGSKVVTAEGQPLGRVVDIQITAGPYYEVIALILGEVAWLYRFNVLQPFVRRFGLHLKPHVILWDAVKTFERFTVTLKPGMTWEPLREPVRERR